MRRRFFLHALALSLFLGGLSLSGCDDDDEVRTSEGLVSVGDSCPGFTVEGLTGGSYTFPVSGKPSVLFFFTTTCPDCIQQFPVVHELYELYGDRVSFLAVGRGETVESLAGFLEKNDYGIEAAADGSSEVYGLFARSGVPRVYFMRNDKVMFLSDDSAPLSLERGIEYIESLLRFY